jgi:hypothetical protein
MLAAGLSEKLVATAKLYASSQETVDCIIFSKITDIF